VHLCLAVFDDATQAAVLGSATKRAHAVSQLAELVHAHGADGVNIDVESLEGIYKDELVLFTQEMKAAVDEVFLATPMVDWWGSYDYDALAMASDGLFIMGYDAHSNGGNPGPIGPLEAGSLWPYWSLVWALEDYRTWGAPDDKIIMGLPLYGREWPAESDAIPGVATADGDSMAIASAIGRAADFPGRYEEVSESPWAWTGSSQLWYDDTDSIAVKIEWAIDEGIQGVGFWAVGYTGGDTEFWNMVDDLSMSEDADADADAGAGADAGPGDDTASPTTDTAEATDSADPADTADPADGGEAGDGSGSGPRDGPSAGYREMSDDDDDEPTPKGCGCSVTHPSPSTFWLLAGVLGLLGRRRENTQN
jgi:MYXO-CTERM domain-containing protein